MSGLKRREGSQGSAVARASHALAGGDVLAIRHYPAARLAVGHVVGVVHVKGLQVVEQVGTAGGNVLYLPTVFGAALPIVVAAYPGAALIHAPLRGIPALNDPGLFPHRGDGLVVVWHF